MILGLGGEVLWWCPSLDTEGNGTIILNDLVHNSNGTLTGMDPDMILNIRCDNQGAIAKILKRFMKYL